MKYYSQFGQDQYLWKKYFQHGDTAAEGTFVDIGAHDGVSGSNTKFFEERGWGGICFEPLPNIFERLKQNRTCSKFNIAISDETGWAPFRSIKGYSEMLSGLVDSQTRDHLERITREVQEYKQEVEIIEVQTRQFNDVVTYKNIDYLSIDTEGSEEKIIRNIDFNYYSIGFMSVEFNPGSSESLHQYILSKGYALDVCLGVDRIYRKV